MSWTIVLYGLVPLIAFVVVDFYGSMKWAVIAAILFALADVGVMYWMNGVVDWASVVAFALIIVLGLVTLKLENPLYIKLQPVAVAVLLAGIVGYFQFAGGGLVAKYLPLLREGVSDDVRQAMDDPRFMALMERAVTGLIAVLVVHGAWIAWAAYNASNVTWLLIRGLGFWAVFAVYMVLFSIVTATGL